MPLAAGSGFLPDSRSGGTRALSPREGSAAEAPPCGFQRPAQSGSLCSSQGPFRRCCGGRFGAKILQSDRSNDRRPPCPLSWSPNGGPRLQNRKWLSRSRPWAVGAQAAQERGCGQSPSLVGQSQQGLSTAAVPGVPAGRMRPVLGGFFLLEPRRPLASSPTSQNREGAG